MQLIPLLDVVVNAPISNNEKLILILLAGSIERGINPSCDQLEKQSGVTARTVAKCLDRLESSGLISSTRRQGTAGIYQLNFGNHFRTTEVTSETISELPISVRKPVPNFVNSALGSETISDVDKADLGVQISTIESEGRATTTPSLSLVKDLEAVDVVSTSSTPDRAREASIFDWRPKQRWIDQAKLVTERVDIGQSIAKYVIRCQERKTEPSSDEWLRWTIEDDKQLKVEYAKALEPQYRTVPWYEA